MEIMQYSCYVLPKEKSNKRQPGRGKGQQALNGPESADYQGNREGEGSPGEGQDHLSQPPALAERRMEIRSSCL